MLVIAAGLDGCAIVHMGTWFRRRRRCRLHHSQQDDQERKVHGGDTLSSKKRFVAQKLRRRCYLRKMGAAIRPRLNWVSVCSLTFWNTRPHPLTRLLLRRPTRVAELVFDRMHTRVRHLARCFVSGEPVPKQRKPYEKRRQSSACELVGGRPQGECPEHWIRTVQCSGILCGRFARWTKGGLNRLAPKSLLEPNGLEAIIEGLQNLYA